MIPAPIFTEPFEHKCICLVPRYLENPLKTNIFAPLSTEPFDNQWFGMVSRYLETPMVFAPLSTEPFRTKCFCMVFGYLKIIWTQIASAPLFTEPFENKLFCMVSRYLENPLKTNCFCTPFHGTIWEPMVLHGLQIPRKPFEQIIFAFLFTELFGFVWFSGTSKPRWKQMVFCIPFHGTLWKQMV